MSTNINALKKIQILLITYWPIAVLWDGLFDIVDLSFKRDGKTLRSKDIRFDHKFSICIDK